MNTALANSNQELLRAVIYLRVSTKEQAEMGGEAEGFSIPAQREACYRKAADLGAEVVDEYCDRGESARSADRPALQRLLVRLRNEHDVDFVIVHKVDRLARSRLDDVTINLAIQQAKARLVSVTESIDETPSGKLLHGIMATMAEFYSANLATEVKKGALQKVKRGGTPFFAPIGYLNVREFHDGREARTIGIDPERGPIVQWAFTAYATGNYTQRQILEAMTEQGLRSRPRGNKPAKVLSLSRVTAMLSDPYYVGTVTYCGQRFDGRHPRLIEQATFDRVQAVIREHAGAGERDRVHHHYLKGCLRCGRCGTRLVFNRAKGQHGGTYDYYFCTGRMRGNGCTQPYVRVEALETAVEQRWRAAQLAPEYADRLRDLLREEIALMDRYASVGVKQQEQRLADLEAKRRRLVELVLEGAIPSDLVAERQQAINKEMGDARRQMARADKAYGAMRSLIDEALDRAASCYVTYRSAPEPIRREWNQAFFEYFEVIGEQVTGSKPKGPTAVYLEPGLDQRLERDLEMIKNTKDPKTLYERQGSNKLVLVYHVCAGGRPLAF